MRRHSVASSTPLNDLSDASRMNPLFMPQPQLFGRRNHGTDGAGPIEPETYNTRLTESAQNCTHWLKSFPLDDNKEANCTPHVGLALGRIIDGPETDNC
jgi:hypothetical protein